MKNLDNKKGQFNVIHESLCSRCSNTLEESIVLSAEKHKNMNFEIENSILSDKIVNYHQKVNNYNNTIRKSSLRRQSRSN